MIILICLLVVFFSFVIGLRTGNHRKIVYNAEWKEISKFPIPKDIREIWVSDGYSMELSYRPEYDYKGKCTFRFGKRIATHWLPPPNLPDKKPAE